MKRRKSRCSSSRVSGKAAKRFRVEGKTFITLDGLGNRNGFIGAVSVDIHDRAELAGDLERDMREKIPYLGRLKGAAENTLGETDIKAGWKVVVDNYVECYHCDHAHPAFADILCMDDYRHDTFDLWARQLGPACRITGQPSACAAIA